MEKPHRDKATSIPLECQIGHGRINSTPFTETVGSIGISELDNKTLC